MELKFVNTTDAQALTPMRHHILSLPRRSRCCQCQKSRSLSRPLQRRHRLMLNKTRNDKIIPRQHFIVDAFWLCLRQQRSCNHSIAIRRTSRRYGFYNWPAVDVLSLSFACSRRTINICLLYNIVYDSVCLYVCLFVCLSVCLVQHITVSFACIGMIFCRRVI